MQYIKNMPSCELIPGPRTTTVMCVASIYHFLQHAKKKIKRNVFELFWYDTK